MSLGRCRSGPRTIGETVDHHPQINILDTHVWLWLMEGDPRIEAELVERFEKLAISGRLYVAAPSLWEVASLEAAGRIRFAVPVTTWLTEALETPGLNLLTLNPETAAESARLPGEFAGDAVDRILIAAARTRTGRIYTADPDILTYAERGYVDAVRAG